jgi:hypothetical protein
MADQQSKIQTLFFILVMTKMLNLDDENSHGCPCFPSQQKATYVQQLRIPSQKPLKVNQRVPGQLEHQ